MADDDIGPDEATQDDAALAVAARHALHDEELVAAFATGSLDDKSDLERARSFVERCTACRDLHRDVEAIGSALRMDAKGTMVAPRDFRLTVEDAQRLGGTVLVGGFRARLRRSIASFAAPIGASFAALGIVGLLVGSAALSGRVASSPNAGGTGSTASNAPVEMQTGEGQPASVPKSSERTGAYGPQSSAYATQVDTPTPRDTAAVDSNPAMWLLAGSVALLVAGVVLLFVTFRRGRGEQDRPRDP